jgi:hypothetical protein
LRHNTASGTNLAGSMTEEIIIMVKLGPRCTGRSVHSNVEPLGVPDGTHTCLNFLINGIYSRGEMVNIEILSTQGVMGGWDNASLILV